MEHLRDETNNGRLIRILFGEDKCELESAVFEWSIVWSMMVCRYMCVLK